VIGANGGVGQRADPLFNDVGFGSPHSAGMNSVFGDGSVRMISFDIDQGLAGTLYRLCFRSDGLTIDEGAY
jgi:prepilin-type processing-associated H-X9-DG protein